MLNNLIYSQLYYNTGSGFNEIHSIRSEYENIQNALKFNTSHTEDIQSIRFDPLNGPCIINIFSIKARIDNELSNLVYSQSNNEFQIGDIMIFTNEDPSIEIPLKTTGKITEILINIEYLSSDKTNVNLINRVFQLYKNNQFTLDDFISSSNKLILNRSQSLNTIEDNIKNSLIQQNKDLKSTIVENRRDINNQILNLKSKSKDIIETINSINIASQKSYTANFERILKKDSEFENQKLKIKKLEYTKEIIRNKLDKATTEIKNNISLINNLTFKNRKIEMLENENNDVEKLLKQGKKRIISLEKQIDLLNSEILHQRNSINDLKNKYELKNKEVLKINKNLIDNQESSSYKIGFFLTYPFRKIYDTFSSDFIPIKLIKHIFKNPLKSISLINRNNLKTLNKALKNEPIKTISANIEGSIEKSIKLSSESHIQDDIRYHIDLASVIDNNIIIIKGWAFANTNLTLKISIENQIFTHQIKTQIRHDVNIAFPKCKRSLNSGFLLIEDIKLKNSIETIDISLKSENNFITISPILENKLDTSTFDKEEQYQIYIRKYLNKLNNTLDTSGFEYTPIISLIVPVYNVDPKWLNLCVESVINQYYENWEICIYDDKSTNVETIKCLKKWENYKDKRIKIAFGKQNINISLASNQAIKLATGEFVGLLDNDDELTPNALYEVVKTLNSNPQIDLLYSDEDKLEMDGSFSGAYFKSDFNIDLLRTNNYICHFSVIRKSVGDKIGWFRSGVEGAQDHDLILRIVDNIEEKNIYHIPKILYHWRKIPGSTAAEYSDKSYAYEAGVIAISDHIKRNSFNAKVVRLKKGGGIYKVEWFANQDKKIAIIIPFRDKVELLKTCIESIIDNTSYKNYELILINNNSKEKKTIDYIQKITDTYRHIKSFNYNIEFNYSKINNWAVKKTKAKYILFLNNDTKVITKNWLIQLAGFIQRDDVTAVGCRLLYEDKTIQHEGIMIGVNGIAGHIFNSMPTNIIHHFSFGMDKNVSACTAACLLVDRKDFEDCGGFDEENFKIAFNDIDLCLKLRELNKLIVFTPDVKLIHYESKTRGYEDTQEKKERFLQEINNFKAKWQHVMDKDPYYNINLSREKLDYSLNTQFLTL